MMAVNHHSNPTVAGSLFRPASKHILLIDDDREEFILFREALTQVHPHAKIDYFWRPEQWLQRLPSYRPELIFLDMNMPGFDGLQWLDLLGGSLHQPPVIMQSTANNPAGIHKAYQCGAHLYLVKPATLRDYVHQLKKVLALDWSLPDAVKEQQLQHGTYRAFNPAD